jgi:catalase
MRERGGTPSDPFTPEVDRADDLEQEGLLCRVLNVEERTRLVASIAGHLGGASREVQLRQVKHFIAADAEYGARVAAALKIA